jgi:Flp pilus assembly protein TadG
MIVHRFLGDTRGAAAVEMALVMPILMALMFGGLEAGHYFWTEHKALEGVRAGARYAARLPMSTVCPSSGGIPAQTITDIKNVTRTGKLDANAAPVVPGWTAAKVSVNFHCGTFLSSGIYTTLGGQGATVTVASSNLTYPSLMGALGFIRSTAKLSAASNAPVIGI